MRCYELDSTVAGTTSTATVNAGSNVGFKASNTMGHPGYFSAYLSVASPAANSPSAATGATWFKIWEWAPRWTKETGLIFDSVNLNAVNFTIPKATPSGQYLLRVEHIALHIAGAPQFYIGCAQLNIANGGSGSPSPKVAIPGVYTGSEVGLTLNQYNLPADFTGYPSREYIWLPLPVFFLMKFTHSWTCCLEGMRR